MTGDIEHGGDYNVDENSDGDFVINHSTNGDILKYDESADRITILKADEKIEDVVDALLVGGTNVTLTYDDAGNSLTIDAAGGTDTRTDVSDGGTTVVSDTTDINFGSNISASDDGDGTATVQSLGVDSPKVFTRAELNDTESIEHDIPVNDTETLTIYRWGVHRTSDDTAPTGLDVELVDAGDAVQTAANTVDNENSSGITSLSNSSGSLSIYTVRLYNGTGSTEEVAGHFAYIVE